MLQQVHHQSLLPARLGAGLETLGCYPYRIKAPVPSHGHPIGLNRHEGSAPVERLAHDFDRVTAADGAIERIICLLPKAPAFFTEFRLLLQVPSRRSGDTGRALANIRPVKRAAQINRSTAGAHPRVATSEPRP